MKQAESGKRLNLSELSEEQRRQLIDAQQVYGAWREAADEKRRRFTGGVRWAARGGKDYLLRKTGQSERSLGARNPETERTYAAFIRGRSENQERLKSLARRLDEMAPVNRAMGLSRMPVIAARVVRRLDEKGLVGEQLIIVGTNALYAYEALAGVRVESGLVATGDLDLLYDARRRLRFVVRDEINKSGLIGLLKSVDSSFASRSRDFRAINKDGYLVDLIRPQDRCVLIDDAPATLSENPEDMEGAPIEGLAWLVNAPKVYAIVIDARGYPLRVAAVDPRVFALHKLWLSKRADRSTVKARRDFEQARIAAEIAKQYLRLSFDEPDIAALPATLREQANTVFNRKKNGREDSDAPDW